MKSTVDEFFHVADHDVNLRQPNVGLFRRFHSLLVLMLLPDKVHRRKRIGFHSLASAKVSGKKLLHAVLGYTAYSFHGDESDPFFTTLSRHKYRSFTLGTTTP